MDQRQVELLKSIIIEHIRTMDAISSKLLAENFYLSAATIRNEMSDLEKLGYITQTHTSSGRIPTEDGYRFFVEMFLEENKIHPNEKEIIRHEVKANMSKQNFHSIVKLLADLSHEATFIVIPQRGVVLAGFSYLLRQPELLREHITLMNVGEIIDELQNKLFSLCQSINDVEIFIGSQNPLAAHLTSILCKFDQDQENAIIGLLGPMRMDYSRNYSLLKYTRETLQEYL